MAMVIPCDSDGPFGLDGCGGSGDLGCPCGLGGPGRYGDLARPEGPGSFGDSSHLGHREARPDGLYGSQGPSDQLAAERP